MKFAMNENTLLQCGLIEFLESCGKAGFAGVELSYPKLKEALRFLPAAAIREKIAESGMEVLTLNAFEDVYLVPDDEGSIAAVEAEARLVGELCRAVGCPAVVLPVSRWFDRYGALPGKEEITGAYRKSIARYQRIFSEYGVTMMFEPIDYPEFVVGTADWTNEILESFPDIPVVPDIHNMFINGDGSGQVAKLKNPIGVFHIDDTVEGEKAAMHVTESRTFPGEGRADAPAWIHTAQKLGYDGYYSLELFDPVIYAMESGEAAEFCMQKLKAFERMVEQSV
jgi:sugar phosphate isomerase/epimerase